MPAPLHLRVFLSSPGDVADERALARRLLKEELPYRHLLRGRVEFEVVSWDDPAARVPILATLTPQESVNRGMPKPSACDVVVVVLWGRMGTPLPDDIRKRNGTPYLSGTEWEYEDAVNANPKPDVWVFRRTPGPLLHPEDPKLDEQVEQYRRVEQFFDRFTNYDASLKGGYTTYDTPSAFKSLLADYCEALVDRRLKEAQAMAVPTTGGTSAQQAAPAWQGSPYPGLRAFTSEEAAIFFGRGRKTDALIARLRDPDQRFLAVVGASGTGKSSLVRAGLLPRLIEGAIEGSQHWCVLTFTPGAIHGDPFMALAVKLEPELPPGARKGEGAMATALATAPQRITGYAATILAVRPAAAALVLVIDQFEELFTLVTPAHRAAFIDLLTHAAGDPRLLMLATLRADFLPLCTAEPKLAALLQGPAGIFLLGPPGPLALAEMIRKPAERAGLDIEEDLVEAILKDAGADPGVLPLIAFCLEALYRPKAPQHQLTLAAYENLGRLRGAIGQQANSLLTDLRHTERMALDAALPQLFRALVHFDAAGMATRRRFFATH